MLSIIIPSYNEEGNVAKCASVVSKLLSENGIDYELVFVNDGSKDRTWDIISNLARNDEHIVGVNFQEISARRAQFSQDLKLQRVTLAYCWTVICSSRLRS